MTKHEYGLSSAIVRHWVSCHSFVVGHSSSSVDVRASVCFHAAVKWFAIFLLLVQCSCTTLVNRRDLYSPERAPDSLEAARQWYGVTTTSTTIRTRWSGVP